MELLQLVVVDNRFDVVTEWPLDSLFKGQHLGEYMQNNPSAVTDTVSTHVHQNDITVTRSQKPNAIQIRQNESSRRSYANYLTTTIN